MIRVTNLTKTFGDVTAVAGVDLSVERGEFMVLLGPSGCGKTTTLRCIAGLETPDAGVIEVAGERYFDGREVVPTHGRGLGMVFQSYAIWPHMTVAQNVGFPLRIGGASSEERIARTREVLASVGLDGYAERYPAELSGGQQQRVALARAIVSDPPVILYDEPLSNLDAKLRQQMRFELRRIHDELSITALYVTHDQQEALVLADRVCVMEGGRVVQEGSPRDVYERPVSRFASDFLGVENIFDVVDVDRANATAVLSDGGRLRVNSQSPGLASYAEGGSHHVGVRAHNINVAATGQAPDGSLNGAIENAVFLGDRVRYEVRVGSSTVLLADVGASNPLLPAGAQVDVVISPDHVVLLRD